MAIELAILGLRGLTASGNKALTLPTRLVPQPQQQLEIKILESVVYPSQTLVSIGIKALIDRI